MSDADRARARGTGLDADVMAAAGFDLVDLAAPTAATGGPATPAHGHRVLYGPSGTAVLTAVDRQTARRTTAATTTTATTAIPACTCPPANHRAEHRVHAAAGILLALHRRQLSEGTGASPLGS